MDHYKEYQEFCVVCGGPPGTNDSTCSAGERGVTHISTAWLQDWAGVTPEQPDKPQEIGEYDCYGCWKLPGGSRFTAYRGWFEGIAPNLRQHDELCGAADSCHCPTSSKEGALPAVCPNSAAEPGLHWMKAWCSANSGWVRYGVPFHRACGQLLQQQLGYSLNFQHIWPLLQQQRRHISHLTGSYGGVEQYHGVDTISYPPTPAFLFKYLPAAHHYMLLDPLQCSGNADRIVRVWEPLVQQFQRSEGHSKHPSAVGPQPARRGRGGSKGNHSSRGSGSSRDADGTEKQESSKGSGLQTRRRTRAAAAKATAEDTAASVLPLLFSNTCHTAQEQLHLAAQLLPLSSSMLQLLAGCIRLDVAANTWPRVSQVATWVRKYGGVVHSLRLNVVVDCCDMDAGKASEAAQDAISHASAGSQGLRLLSFSAHIPSSRAANKLLRSLPLAHLTALHLTGSATLSAQAAAALVAATGLTDLILPGAGLAEALTKQPPLQSVLSGSLQRLRLSEAGGCSANALRTLSDQLSGLTRLALDYSPQLGAGIKQNRAKDVVLSGGHFHIQAGVQECWAQLPALRSLSVGASRCGQHSAVADTLQWLGSAPSPEKPYLEVSSTLIKNIAALQTSLTSLVLGQSAWLAWPDNALDGNGLNQLLPALQQLKGLCKLELTLQVIFAEHDVDEEHQVAVMHAVAELTQLQDLTLSDNVCAFGLSQLEQLLQRLDGNLAHIQIVCGESMCLRALGAMRRFADKWPDLVVLPEQWHAFRLDD